VRILLVNSDPDIQVSRGSRISMIADGVPANQEVFNPVRVQTL